jgi:hypothetical protein
LPVQLSLLKRNQEKKGAFNHLENFSKEIHPPILSHQHAMERDSFFPSQQHLEQITSVSTENPVVNQPSTSAATNGDNEKKRPFSAVIDTDQADYPSSADPSPANDNDNNYNQNTSDVSNNNQFIRKATDKDGAPLSEKKLRRLEKNRLSARECRRRKREATENMERQINLLEGENLRLRLQLQVCDDGYANIHGGEYDGRFVSRFVPWCFSRLSPFISFHFPLFCLVSYSFIIDWRRS